MTSLFKRGSNSSTEEYNLESVKIDKDGVVRLNLDSDIVRDRIVAQVKKLKEYQGKLVVR